MLQISVSILAIRRCLTIVLGVTALLRGVASNGGTLALLAVNDQLLVLPGLLVAELLLERLGFHVEGPSKDSGERKVDRARDVSRQELLRLADINYVCVLGQRVISFGSVVDLREATHRARMYGLGLHLIVRDLSGLPVFTE